MTTVLIHLNLTVPLDDPDAAEEWAREYCEQKGIREDVVALEAQ